MLKNLHFFQVVQWSKRTNCTSFSTGKSFLCSQVFHRSTWTLQIPFTTKQWIFIYKTKSFIYWKYLMFQHLFIRLDKGRKKLTNQRYSRCFKVVINKFKIHLSRKSFYCQGIFLTKDKNKIKSAKMFFFSLVFVVNINTFYSFLLFHIFEWFYAKAFWKAYN